MISAEHRLDFQKLMTRNVGVLRDALSLEEAQAELKKYLDEDHNLNELNFANIEMSHLVLIAQSLISSALARQETRGCHPDLQESYRGHFFTNNVRNKPVFLPMKSER
jgi:L-aspartate oxidase